MKQIWFEGGPLDDWMQEWSHPLEGDPPARIDIHLFAGERDLGVFAYGSYFHKEDGVYVFVLPDEADA